MKTQTIKVLPVLALAGPLFVWAPKPAQADTMGLFGLPRNSPAGMDVVQNRQRVGPFATWTRANEVANYYRRMGYYTTQAFHSGDGYYFDLSMGDGNG
jgi:hypothetical protein